MERCNERMEEIRRSMSVVVEEMRTLDSYKSSRGKFLTGIYNDLSGEFEALQQSLLHPDCDVAYDYAW